MELLLHPCIELPLTHTLHLPLLLVLEERTIGCDVFWDYEFKWRIQVLLKVLSLFI